MHDIDAAVKGRLMDTKRPGDLNTEACVELAGAILKGLADALSEAAVRAAEHPSPENMRNLRSCRGMYDSDYFKALSAGVAADGQAVARQIIRTALRGRKLKAEVEAR